LFITGRKLKPIVQKRETVAFEQISECALSVHIIKGENVPVRDTYVNIISGHLDLKDG